MAESNYSQGRVTLAGVGIWGRARAGLPWLAWKLGASQGEVTLAGVEIESQPGLGFPGKCPPTLFPRASSSVASGPILLTPLSPSPPQSIHKKKDPAKAGPFLIEHFDYFRSRDFFICWMTRACWALASAATIWSMASLASASTSPPSLSATFLRTRTVRAGE